MPTETDPKDLETPAVPGPPSDTDLEGVDETPAEVDPAGTKEADAVAGEPEVEIDSPSPEDQPSPEPTPPTEPDATGDSTPSDEGAEPDGYELDGSTEGEPPVLTPELEPSPEDPSGPPSSEEVEAVDAEFEPVESEDEPKETEDDKAPEPEPLPEEEPKPAAEPEGAYSGLHADKGHIGAALGKGGTDELLAAANKSFALVDLLRRVAAEAAEAERQEAQFLLGIGALWLAQLERWLARR